MFCLSSSLLVRRLYPVLAVGATVLGLACGGRGIEAAENGSTLASFQTELQPILRQYCYDCHGDGRKKGGVNLDAFKRDADLHDVDLWLRTLKNVRSGIMPPVGEDKLSAEEKAKVLLWIKRKALQLDPARPDPGRVTLRRLNRVEYKNTIHDLVGVKFKTEEEFPADDTGRGFDTIADVLTISPLLLEKYLDAAQVIVARAVPVQAREVAKRKTAGRAFRLATQTEATKVAKMIPDDEEEEDPRAEGLDLSYYRRERAEAKLKVGQAGSYRVRFDLDAVETYVDNVFDYNKCRVTLRVDGQSVHTQEMVREGRRNYLFDYEVAWTPGEHEVAVEIEPLTAGQPQPRNLRLRLNSVTLYGPQAPEFYVEPTRYREFFPLPHPTTAEGNEAFARAALQSFATRAFRRPVERNVLDRLVGLALATAELPDTSIEAGVAQAMTAVLASPRFLFREDAPEKGSAEQAYARIDEYSLASRLSYFLWSSMPDAELFALAERGELRAQLRAQVRRMLASEKAGALVKNFTGQWLQARDIPHVPIEAMVVHLRDFPNPEIEEAMATFRRLVRVADTDRTAEEKVAFDAARKKFFGFARSAVPQLKPSLRTAMQKETEMLFASVLAEGRSVLDLLNADYAHLNEELAQHYGIDGVKGGEMRRVSLPAGSLRGGILTQGTVLAVTSNPTRTSPVKRGVFILDNVLGAPPPPPPPNVPTLEEAANAEEMKRLSLRNTLALHASKPLCHSCHSRMDPLGLALENFNALGRFRERELNLPIEPQGTLITGESFSDVRELKRVLITDHRSDFYYCLSEKLLTYALGRSIDYYDVTTLDSLVDQLDSAGGRLDELVLNIIESTPFQYRRLHQPSATGTAVSLANPAARSSLANQGPPHE